MHDITDYTSADTTRNQRSVEEHEKTQHSRLSVGFAKINSVAVITRPRCLPQASSVAVYSPEGARMLHNQTAYLQTDKLRPRLQFA